jgi:hypothetical protein
MLEENTYDEIPSGRVDTLVKAIERIERLEKQLKIAVEASKNLTNSDNWSVEQVDGEHVFCFNMKYPWRFTGDALKKIEELKNE